MKLVNQYSRLASQFGLWRLLCRQWHQRHVDDIDVEAGVGAEDVEE
jgi:hypothetical protein